MRVIRLLGFFCLMLLMVTVDSTAWEMTDGNGELFSFGGYMTYRGRNYDLDFDSGSERTHLNRKNYFGDVSLQFKVKPASQVTAFFELQKYIFLGQEYRYNTIQTGEDVAAEDIIANISTDPNAPYMAKLPLRRNTDEAWEFHMRQAWMDVMLPAGIPFNLKFGRQGLILGNGIYTNSNLATVFGYQFYSTWGADNPTLRFGSMKFYEGIREDYEEEEGVDDPDDADIYFVDSSIPVPFGSSTKVGAFLTTFRDNSFALDLMSHYNLGLTANVALESGWTLNSEFDYQVGSIEHGQLIGNGDLDLSGYAFMVNVGAPAILNNMVKLSGEFGIGSGDDSKTLDKFEGYVGVGPFYAYAWAYEYRFLHLIHNSSHFFTQYGSRGMYENLAPGLENTTYLKATATVTLPYKCNYTFSPIYLGLTQEGESFGYEFDNIINAPIWDNFSYQFIFAYVMPSDYMKDRPASPKYPPIKDDSWAIRSQLSLTY